MTTFEITVSKINEQTTIYQLNNYKLVIENDKININKTLNKKESNPMVDINVFPIFMMKYRIKNPEVYNMLLMAYIKEHRK